MDTHKNNQGALPPLTDSQVQMMTEKIAQRVDMDKSEIADFIRSYWFKMFLELEETGKADFLGVGELEIDKDNPGRYKIIRYSEEKKRMKRQLKLQQQLGGETGSIGTLPSQEPLHILLDFDFPLEDLIAQLAEHRGVPVERMLQKFRDQLDRAFKEMVKNGDKGILPDFGFVQYGDAGLRDIIFDVNEEVAELLRGQAD